MLEAIQIPHQFKPEIIIGIDPDVDESGVGVVYRTSRSVTPMKFSFPNLIDYLTMTRDMNPGKVLVVLEGGWLVRSNWHLGGGYMTMRKTHGNEPPDGHPHRGNVQPSRHTVHGSEADAQGMERQGRKDNAG